MTLNGSDIRAHFAAHPSTDCVELVADVDGRAETIFVRSPDVPLRQSGEMQAACLLLPAMRRGGTLSLSSDVDRRFSDNLRAVQEVYCQWDKSLRRVQVQCGVRADEPAGGRRVGLFFSGGVDSLYSLLQHQDEITDLIFVRGFDIRLNDDWRIRQAEERIGRIGAHFGKRVVRIETNMRDLLDTCGDWGALTHGAALAAVGHAMPQEFRRLLIASSDGSPDPAPWGSHPRLDPLWSNSRCAFVHDGCESGRIEKIRRIAESEIALQTLRVCWKNSEGQLNCGRCEKCIRTMIALRVVGALDRCPSFAAPLRVHRMLRLVFHDPANMWGQRENLQALRTLPRARAMYWALAFVFLRSHLRVFRKKLFR